MIGVTRDPPQGSEPISDVSVIVATHYQDTVCMGSVYKRVQIIVGMTLHVGGPSQMPPPPQSLTR